MTLAELLADLERCATEAEAMNAWAPVKDVIRPLIQKVRELDDTPTSSDTKDRLIAVTEAAKRIGMSTRYIYANKDKLSFVRQNGGRAVRCSERGVEQWARLNPR